MIKKFFKAIWVLFLEVVSIPIDIIAFIWMLIQAISLKRRYDTSIVEFIEAYLKNVEHQYIARINWINGDNSIWKF